MIGEPTASTAVPERRTGLRRPRPPALRLGARLAFSGARLAGVVAAALVVGIALAFAKGLQPTLQTTVNGVVSGSYFALGAVGLTLVYGVLRLINFAHGDMLTFGAYIALLANVHFGLPFALSALVAVSATALLGVGLEVMLWRPMRARGARLPQLLLITVGIAFLIRNGIQLVAGSAARSFQVDIITTYHFGGLMIGRTQAIVVAIGFAVLIVVGVVLRGTRLGKQMRAVSDDFTLAETTGIDTQRVVYATWVLAGALAGLAGVVYGSSLGSMSPNLGYSLILSLFAAAVLGGVGNVYGALVGAILIGLSEEWSTLLFDARWKPAVGFAILIATLFVRPQGLFGASRTV